MPEMVQGSVVAAGVLLLIALVWFMVKALVGHWLATEIGKRIAARRRAKEEDRR